MSKSINSYCRLCAESKPENKLVNLLLDDQKRAEILMKLIRLNATSSDFFLEDILPQTVCFECTVSLNRAFDFVTAVEQAQITLNTVFLEKEFKSELLLDSDNLSASEALIESEDDFNGDTIIKQESDISHSVSEHISNQMFKNKHTKETFVTEDSVENDLDGIPLSQLKLTWEDYIWTCPYCETQFSSIGELKTHSIKYHNCCNAFRCFDCNARKFRLDKFIVHVKRHRKYLKLSCYICFANFSNYFDANSHQTVHFNSKYLCPGCNTSFSTEEDMSIHQSTLYKDRRTRPIPTIQNLNDSLTCIICNKTFQSKGGLSSHLLIHTDRQRNHTCDKCGKCFYSKQTLIGHMLLHDDARPFQCVICKFGFKTKGLLRNHVGVHDGQKPFSCDKCGRCFRLQKQLNSHSIIHTDSLPYVCTFCNKSFRFKTILNQHIRQHTGVKPYSCEICKRDFTNWPNYNKHMKRLHGMDMSKKKHTPDGLYPINPKTGEIIPYPVTDNTEEWKKEIISSKRSKPGRPKSKCKLKPINLDGVIRESN